MSNTILEDYSLDEGMELLRDDIDSIVMVDVTSKKYKALKRGGIFGNYIAEQGDYEELIQKLWFRISDSNEEITDEYKAFTSYYGNFEGKYSRRFKIFVGENDTPHFIQMTVYPIKGIGKYILVMNELDDGESVEEFMTTRKVNTIQNTYLFSMYVDLMEDTTSSISVTEISDDTINSTIKYSEWRLMTVNMIWSEDKAQFLKMTDPEYLKENLAPGRTTSFDCMMMNLEGKYIWVKLIFSRTKTTVEDDFRFVFMVQDINDDAEDLMATLKTYEELAVTDALTGIYNYGGIKTEIANALEVFRKDGQPLSLVMLDLDFFKNVNDTYGHSVGDITLKTFAKILTEAVEGKKASVGRWGGEEFVIICSGKAEDELLPCAERLRKIVEKTEFPEVGHITCSIGVTQFKKDDSFDDAFRRVDKALYTSKKSGRNLVTVL
ncbi:GGDEF domain-containing protein [Butyrivibrio sp. JL13D10]|uniref:GGDEF domain-containing protein n=1 Tax=Butyrivibrio sp. JL13D10 TaxID=3236815 RepID=UPI0038B4569D